MHRQLPRPVRERRDLWLVRHGESTWNAAGLVQGQQRLPGLTARGAVQARRCARTIADAPVRAVVTSDLRRAMETARPIARAFGLDVAVDARLRERSFGAAEGMPSAAVGPELTGIDGDCVVDADAAPVGGESVLDLYERATCCVADLVCRYTAGDLVVVCHGGVVRVVLSWLGGTGPQDMAWPAVGNGLVVRRPLSDVLEAITRGATADEEVAAARAG